MRVAILGAGASGICLGVKLREAGFATSRSSRSPRTSAGRGTTTAIRVRAATCRRTSTRSRSSARRTGRGSSRRRRRSRTTSATSSTSTACGRTSASAARSRAARFDEAAGVWRLRTAAGEEHRGRGARLGRRPAEPAARAGVPGPRDASAARALPLGALGPRRRSRRQARGGDRQRRERGAVRPARGGAGRARGRLPAHAQLRDAAPRLRLQRAREVAVRARAGPRAALPLVDLLELRAALPRVPRPRRGLARAPHPAGVPRLPRGRDPRPEAARGAHARLRAGLQAPADLRRLHPGAAARERRAW